MDRLFYEKIFSTQRMEKYFNYYPNDVEKAIKHYKLNIELSESFYSVLSIFEVSLRNSLNRELTNYFGTADWYLLIYNEKGLQNLYKNVKIAENHIINRNETITANKVIAELTLGFWVRLLNAEYERILWKIGSSFQSKNWSALETGDLPFFELANYTLPLLIEGYQLGKNLDKY